MNAGTFAVGLTDVSLTMLLVGAIVLAGATVVMATMPDLRFPRLRRRTENTPATTTEIVPVAQRRVITGRKPMLPPPGVPLPASTNSSVNAGAQVPARQTPMLPDSRRPTAADVHRAEAVIDGYLDTDPQLLATTLSSWITRDETPRRHH